MAIGHQPLAAFFTPPMIAMKTLFMYDKITPLNRQTHQGLRIKPSAQRWLFAKEAHSLLLAGTELPLAALDYPCVFAPHGDQHTMMALVGLKAGQNLMVDEAGHWEINCYVPAFVRRYPFVLAETPQEGAAAPQPLTVCIDSTFDGFNDSEGEALFDAQGEATPHLQQLQKFLTEYHTDLLKTAAFARRLTELDLLVDREIDFQLGSQQFKLNGFKVVDEAKLHALDDASLLALCKSGAMGWIHAHLLSLNNVNTLAARMSKRLQH